MKEKIHEYYLGKIELLENAKNNRAKANIISDIYSDGIKHIKNIIDHELFNN